MDAFQNNVAGHTRDVFGVWVGVGWGWGRIIINVVVVFKKNVNCYGCFPERCRIPSNMSTKKEARTLQSTVVGMDMLFPVAFQSR